MAHYRETEVRCAGLLRMVLTRISQHPAFNRVTTAVWREHLAGINARRSAALDRHLASLCMVVLDIDHFERINDEHGI
jgi:GGDEF domain-containing protein